MSGTVISFPNSTSLIDASKYALVDYLKCFDLPTSVMQSKEFIAYSAYSLVRRLAAGIIDEIQARAMVECAISHSFIGEEQKSELRKKARGRME